jgi:hypothetical protein
MGTTLGCVGKALEFLKTGLELMETPSGLEAPSQNLKESSLGDGGMDRVLIDQGLGLMQA